MKDLSAETMKTIKTAKIMNLLRFRGFTKQLANMSPTTFIRGDKIKRYSILSLDDFFINSTTKFDDFS